MFSKVCWQCPAMSCLYTSQSNYPCVVNKLLKTKVFVDITQQCSALLPEVNFPANNSNFHWRWWDWIQTIFLNLFYFMKKQMYQNWNAPLERISTHCVGGRKASWRNSSQATFPFLWVAVRKENGPVFRPGCPKIITVRFDPFWTDLMQKS